MAKEKKKVDPQDRKQRRLLEQDKARKRIPINIFKTPDSRITENRFKNPAIGVSPAERKEISIQKREDYLKKKQKEKSQDLVKKSRTNGTYKKVPYKKGKSELQRGMDRVDRIKKQQAADDAAFKKRVEKSKTDRAGRATGVSATAGRDLRSKHFIGKKMNMGGVMKNRGGTFKGSF